MDFIPEFAPRFRVHPGGGLIEQQQARRVQQAGGQRQTLLPAAGQGACELLLARAQAQPFQGFIDRLAALWQAEQAANEVQVLADGQILVQAKALRHIAHLPFDLARLSDEVQPQAGAAARVCGEQAAQQADGGGFAAAVGA